MGILKKTANQAKNLMRGIIKTNIALAERGKTPLAVELLGEPGVGKTSICRQVADEFGMDFVKLNLSQFDDLGDFVGFPIRSFEMEKDGEKKWIFDNASAGFEKAGWNFTGLTRTENCPPAWLAGKQKPIMLLLDDWTRAQPRFQQAMMELIHCQTYGDNTLPKGSTILLTSNPDNGDNKVNPIDSAMRTRFGTIEVGFDVKEWAEWAEFNEIDGRCINFFLMNPEVYNPNAQLGDSEGKRSNPRSITMFFESLSLLENFDTPENRDIISEYGDMYVNTYVSGIFLRFISEGLDKLSSPEEILEGNFEQVVDKLKHDFCPNKQFMASIASVVAFRIENFIKKMASEGKVQEAWVDRIGDLIKLEDKNLFPKDIRFDIAKSVFSSDKNAFKKWVLDKELRTIITKR